MPLKNQQRRAIVALVTVVVSLVALVVPLIVMARAQGAPLIKLLNPSDYSDDGNADTEHMPVISDRTTGTDETESPNEDTYRLNAWTQNPPAEALVEFELQTTPATTLTIGTATRSGDAFHYDWDISGITDGQYTLRTILYEGVPESAVEVARDERAVLLLTGNPQADTAGAAADITNLENGGPAGFYTNPITGNTNILVAYEYSEDTTFVGTYYTVSDPGDLASWKNCALDLVNANNEGPAGSVQTTCSLQSADQGGASVTGIAVDANDSPVDPVFGASYDPTFNKAGDAVRVLPYAQDPSTVEIPTPTNRTNASENGTFPCSGVLSATVKDQFGAPVGDVSIDVHATGPSDQLKFHRGLLASGVSSNRPPDRNHTGIEQAFDCSVANQQFAGRQGDHNRVALPDHKHVEGNTSSGGNFSVKFKTDRDGDTFLTFWADEDDDDLFCSQEPAGAAAVGWDHSAPAPVLDPTEVDVCPVPVPPPPGSSSSTSPSTEPSGSTSPSTSTSPPDQRGCTLSGDEGDNVLEGTEGNDVICGNGGDDTISGLGGDDTIYGDDGEDDVDGGDGDDGIDGGADDDTLRGGTENDVIRGSSGDDALAGGGGLDSLRGNSGADNLNGGGDRDVLQGGSGGDVATGGGGNDTMKGGSGGDIVRGGAGKDVMKGGVGGDQLTGGSGNDSLDGGKGRDNCRGGGGKNRQRNCER